MSIQGCGVCCRNTKRNHSSHGLMGQTTGRVSLKGFPLKPVRWPYWSETCCLSRPFMQISPETPSLPSLLAAARGRNKIPNPFNLWPGNVGLMEDFPIIYQLSISKTTYQSISGWFIEEGYCGMRNTKIKQSKALVRPKWLIHSGVFPLHPCMIHWSGLASIPVDRHWKWVVLLHLCIECDWINHSVQRLSRIILCHRRVSVRGLHESISLFSITHTETYLSIYLSVDLDILAAFGSSHCIGMRGWERQRATGMGRGGKLLQLLPPKWESHGVVDSAWETKGWGLGGIRVKQPSPR